MQIKQYLRMIRIGKNMEIKWNGRKHKEQEKDRLREAVFLVFVFVFIFLWAVIQPLNASPDEEMRYQVVQYICNHGSLPDGRDPEVQNALWGTSYAFSPYLSYIVGAGFAKLAGLFTDNAQVLLMAARMVNILLGTLTAWFALRIGKRCFGRHGAYLFATLVCFLPGAVFIHSYVNMDSLALCSTAWIVYCWIKACQDGWSGRLCAELAAALSLCVMSYYNAYGWLLCSALFFAVSWLRCRKEQWDYKGMLKLGFLVLGIVFVLTGWWFIRNAILYDGDFLARSVSAEFAELHAAEEYKPSNHITPQKLGMSLAGMIVWVPGNWQHNWLITVLISFIGTFGFMDIFMPYAWSKAYIFFFALGGAGVFLKGLTCFRVAKTQIKRSVNKNPQGSVRTVVAYKNKVWNMRHWMHVCMVLAAAIPWILLLYYAYCSDFQAQGRYIMPLLIPLMYFVTLGIQNWLERFVNKEMVRKWIYRILSIVIVVSAILVYVLVFRPAYAG